MCDDDGGPAASRPSPLGKDSPYGRGRAPPFQRGQNLFKVHLRLPSRCPWKGTAPGRQGNAAFRPVGLGGAKCSVTSDRRAVGMTGHHRGGLEHPIAPGLRGALDAALLGKAPRVDRRKAEETGRLRRWSGASCHYLVRGLFAIYEPMMIAPMMIARLTGKAASAWNPHTTRPQIMRHMESSRANIAANITKIIDGHMPRASHADVGWLSRRYQAPHRQRVAPRYLQYHLSKNSPAFSSRRRRAFRACRCSGEPGGGQ